MNDKIFVVKEKEDKMFLEEWNKPDKPLMRCGHTANATTTIKPYQKDNVTIHCCVICAGINRWANIVQDQQPDLTGRKAKCSSCDTIADSKRNLAFFEHRPDHEHDLYYCGCRGWD